MSIWPAIVMTASGLMSPRQDEEEIQHLFTLSQHISEEMMTKSGAYVILADCENESVQMFCKRL